MVYDKDKHWDMVYEDMTRDDFETFSSDMSDYLFYDPDYFEEGMRVLDAGCGTGRVVYDLIRKGAKAEFHCIDVSIKKAEEFLPKSVVVKKMDLENIEYPDNHFDYVICRGVLHHTERPYKILRELCRVAKSEIDIITTRRKGLNHLRVYAKRYALKLFPTRLAMRISEKRPFLRHFIFDTAKAPIRKTLNENKVKRVMKDCGVNAHTTSPFLDDLGNGQTMRVRAWKITR